MINQIVLNNNVSIPIIGNGPAGIGYGIIDASNRNIVSRAITKFFFMPIWREQFVNAVSNSFKIGFTLLDNSAAYKNDKYVAKAIRKSKLGREQLFLTSRVSNRAQKTHRIREEFFRSLSELKTDYIDLLQFHWPVTGLYLDTWKEMEKLYKEGYCKAIGVANCHQHHIEAILEIGDIVPAINQIEIHPLFTQKELIKYCTDKGIVVQAYTPIARFDDRLVRLPLLKEIAAKYNKTAVQIILRWHIQTGVIPIVRSLNEKRQKENISIFDFKLSSDEMQAIDSININSRLRYDPDNCDFSIL